MRLKVFFIIVRINLYLCRVCTADDLDHIFDELMRNILIA